MIGESLHNSRFNSKFFKDIMQHIGKFLLFVISIKLILQYLP